MANRLGKKKAGRGQARQARIQTYHILLQNTFACLRLLASASFALESTSIELNSIQFSSVGPKGQGRRRPERVYVIIILLAIVPMRSRRRVVHFTNCQFFLLFVVVAAAAAAAVGEEDRLTTY